MFHVSCFMFGVGVGTFVTLFASVVTSWTGWRLSFLCSLPLSLCLSVSLSAGCLCVAVGIVSPAGFPHDCEEHR